MSGIHREVAGEKDHAYQFFRKDFACFQQEHAGQIEKLKAKLAKEKQKN